MSLCTQCSLASVLAAFIRDHDVTVISHTHDAIVVLDAFQTPDGIWHEEELALPASRVAVEEYLGY